MSATPVPQQTNVIPRYETISGVVERLTYYSQESGYTVARLVRFGESELTTIVGNFADIQPGQTLQLLGLWREHPVEKIYRSGGSHRTRCPKIE